MIVISNGRAHRDGQHIRRGSRFNACRAGGHIGVIQDRPDVFQHEVDPRRAGKAQRPRADRDAKGPQGVVIRGIQRQRAAHADIRTGIRPQDGRLGGGVAAVGAHPRTEAEAPANAKAHPAAEGVHPRPVRGGEGEIPRRAHGHPVQVRLGGVADEIQRQRPGDRDAVLGFAGAVDPRRQAEQFAIPPRRQAGVMQARQVGRDDEGFGVNGHIRVTERAGDPHRGARLPEIGGRPGGRDDVGMVLGIQAQIPNRVQLDRACIVDIGTGVIGHHIERQVSGQAEPFGSGVRRSVGLGLGLSAIDFDFPGVFLAKQAQYSPLEAGAGLKGLLLLLVDRVGGVFLGGLGPGQRKRPDLASGFGGHIQGTDSDVRSVAAHHIILRIITVADHRLGGAVDHVESQADPHAGAPGELDGSQQVDMGGAVFRPDRNRPAADMHPAFQVRQGLAGMIHVVHTAAQAEFPRIAAGLRQTKSGGIFLCPDRQTATGAGAHPRAVLDARHRGVIEQFHDPRAPDPDGSPVVTQRRGDGIHLLRRAYFLPRSHHAFVVQIQTDDPGDADQLHLGQSQQIDALIVVTACCPLIDERPRADDCLGAVLIRNQREREREAKLERIDGALLGLSRHPHVHDIGHAQCAVEEFGNFIFDTR